MFQSTYQLYDNYNLVINGSNVMIACLNDVDDGCLRAADLGSSWWLRCSKILWRQAKAKMNFENLLNGSEQWGEVGGRLTIVGGHRPPPSRPDYTPGSEI